MGAQDVGGSYLPAVGMLATKGDRMPHSGRTAIRETPVERLKRLWSVMAETERNLDRADPSRRPILEVGLQAIQQEASRVSRDLQRSSA